LDKAITSAFLVIASVVCAVVAFNAVYPAVIRSSDAMVNMKTRLDERLKSQIDIVHATGSGSNGYVWVKNTGSLRIVAVDRCDVFFGPEGDFSRIPHESEASGNPYWAYQVEGDSSQWTPSATLKITVYYGSVLSGRYFVKVTTPNGLVDEYYFSS
jgi:archaellum component FlaF (FlaF/FlaG flagellin family)